MQKKLNNQIIDPKKNQNNLLNKNVRPYNIYNSEEEGSQLKNQDINFPQLNEIDKSNKLKKIISIPYQKNCFVIIFKNNNHKNNEKKIKFGFTQRQLTIDTQRYLGF